MHHTLKFYNANRTFVLRFYMFGARLTRVPLIGGLARKIANAYACNEHRGYLLTGEEAVALVSAAGALAAAPCTCRKVFHNCSSPKDNEILLAPTRHVLVETMPHDAREITPVQAADIIRDSQKRGLILTIMKCRGDYYAMCSCCSCCCVPLRFTKKYKIGEALTRHKDIVKEFRDYVTGYKDEDHHH